MCSLHVDIVGLTWDYVAWRTAKSICSRANSGVPFWICWKKQHEETQQIMIYSSRTVTFPAPVFARISHHSFSTSMVRETQPRNHGENYAWLIGTCVDPKKKGGFSQQPGTY